jgi:hypothetical protein
MAKHFRDTLTQQERDDLAQMISRGRADESPGALAGVPMGPIGGRTVHRTRPGV